MYENARMYVEILIASCKNEDKLDIILDIYEKLVENLKVSPKDAFEMLLPICVGIGKVVVAVAKGPASHAGFIAKAISIFIR